MPNPNTAHEPSMEEILASIRQIISEDPESAPAPGPAPKSQDAKSARPQAGPSPAAQPASSESRSGRQEAPFAEAPVSRGGPDSVEPASQSAADAQRPRTPSQTVAPAISPPAARPAAESAPADRAVTLPEPSKLLSEQSKVAVSGAFDALAHTIFAQNARTLEDIVADMMRPMLKGWLDDNLPQLVERLVKEEIERVSRGRR